VSAISSWDEFPVHQTSEPVRHVATSDRNFFDRYYFNCQASSDEIMVVISMGQYPNLGTQDSFVAVQRGDSYRVVRASRELGDRMDLSVGPFRYEVIEPLKIVRCTLDENEHGLSYDLTWRGSIPAVEEQSHFIRRFGRRLFDTCRFAQTGRWTGTLKVGGETFDVEPKKWVGTRDRCWGVRPIGEPEAPGIQAKGGFVMGGFWTYFPMQFDDHSILYIRQEGADGSPILYDARRIWNDPNRAIESLGRVEYKHDLFPGTAILEKAYLRFPDAPGGAIEILCEGLTSLFLSVGTGYGADPDWRHGMYHGPLVVQGREYKTSEIAKRGEFGVIDSVGRFHYGGKTGFGLLEHVFLTQALKNRAASQS